MAPSPTHSATHRNGRVVNIYIADSLMNQYRMGATEQIRKSAFDSICIRFREAYKAKFGDDLVFVDSSDIVLNPLVRAVPTTSSVPRPLVYRPEDERDCDECPRCEQDYHEQCRDPRGCPLA